MLRSIDVGKILIKKLWLTKTDWDDRFPRVLQKECLQYQSQILEIKNVSIPCWIGPISESQNAEIHGFSDASNLAYGAVIYLRIQSSAHNLHTSLLFSKTKVAPLKVQSIPRLELCGAVLLSRAMKFVIQFLSFEKINIHCWTDSTVVLNWIKSYQSKWKAFVANRVSELQKELPNAQWHQISSYKNPANCGSRGCSATDLRSHELWRNGPVWVKLDKECWPKGKEIANTNLEMRGSVNINVQSFFKAKELFSRFSSWSKLLRTFVYIFRFTQHCKFRANEYCN